MGGEPMTAMRKLWTPDEVSDRLCEAVNTLQRMPVPKGGAPGVHRVAWPEIVRDAVEAYGYEEARTKTAAPDPAQIDRMDEALGWLHLVPSLDRRQTVFVTSFARWDETAGKWRRIGVRTAARILGTSKSGVAWRRLVGITEICRSLGS